MKILKNSQISKQFKVSNPTVAHWIEHAFLGRNKLQITKVKEKYYIIDSLHNLSELEKLSNHGKKYKNKIVKISIEANPELINSLNHLEIAEYIQSLEKKIIHPKFMYFLQGSKAWNDYITNQIKSDDGYEGLEILISHLPNLDLILKNYESVNIIDIGQSTGVNPEIVIRYLKNKKIDVNYTNIYTNEGVFHLNQAYLQKKFPELKTEFQPYQINQELISDLLFYKKINNPKKSMNLLLFLDYFLGNEPDKQIVISNLKNSMQIHDYLLINCGVESENEMVFLENHLSNPNLAKMNQVTLTNLGIPEDTFETVVEFDQNLNSIVKKAIFKKEVEINFNLHNGKKRVKFNKDDSVIIYLIYEFDEDELFKELIENKFKVFSYQLHPSQDEAMAFCTVDGYSPNKLPYKK